MFIYAFLWRRRGGEREKKKEISLPEAHRVVRLEMKRSSQPRTDVYSEFLLFFFVLSIILRCQQRIHNTLQMAFYLLDFTLRFK